MGLLEQIIKAGIVGCGGAGFPTGKKLDCEVEWYLVNGAECEPLLRTDRYLMRHKAKELITAVEAAGSLTGASRLVIGLKKSYMKEQEALEQAIEELNSPVELFLSESFYPAGDEQMLVYEVTGRVVPPAGIPLDVGAVVSNVATLVAVYDAMQGKAFTQKYVTVTGEVHNPCIVRAPLGTYLEDCIRLAGGADKERYCVINGGPMMGRIMTMEQAAGEVVTKTTSGIIILPEDHYLLNQKQIRVERMKNLASAACIQCSYCTQMCPRHLIGHPLEPHKIMRRFATGADIGELLDDPGIREAAICSQCGICEIYACPMGLQPRRINALIKEELAKAGIRYARKEKEWIPDPERDVRRIPTKRAASRAGVSEYYDLEIDVLKSCRPDVVCIPLKQHIGVPSEPAVFVGDRVREGQIIARCPQGKLGADIHASLSGEVEKVTDCIVIRGRS